MVEEGIRGKGLTVMLELALSVLEPVKELKREPGSFGFLIVTTDVLSPLFGAGRDHANKEAAATAGDGERWLLLFEPPWTLLSAGRYGTLWEASLAGGGGATGGNRFCLASSGCAGGEPFHVRTRPR